MIREVEQKYEEHPDRLSSMVNYALLLATQRFDLIGAKKLYKDAMEISPENPVLLRAYGIFMLATLEAPRERIFRKALDYFKNAELRDPGRERFEIAEESMYHWNCVAQRENPLALLNYALLQQYLVKDIPRAERFFHRAISALKDTQDAPDPARPAVIENFELFELERLPGGEFHTPVPSNTVVRNSELVELRRANQFHTSHVTPSFARHRRDRERVSPVAWRTGRGATGMGRVGPLQPRERPEAQVRVLLLAESHHEARFLGGAELGSGL